MKLLKKKTKTKMIMNFALVFVSLIYFLLAFFYFYFSDKQSILSLKKNNNNNNKHIKLQNEMFNVKQQ